MGRRAGVGPVVAQCSAHGEPRAGHGAPSRPADGRVEVRFAAPHRRVAAGQSVVLYQGDEVVGGGIATVPAAVVTSFTD